MEEKFDWEIVQKQVLALIGRGKSIEALQLLKKQDSICSPPPAIIGLQARMEAQISGFEAGIKRLDSVPEGSRRHPDILSEKIGLFWECGRNDEARIEAEKALT